MTSLIQTEQRNHLQKFRTSLEEVLPLQKESTVLQGYDIYPTYQIPHGQIHVGFSGLAEWIAEKNSNVILEGYVGVNWQNFISSLDEVFQKLEIEVCWKNINDAIKPEEEIERLIEPFIGKGDPVFGKIFEGEIKDFYEEEKIKQIKPHKNKITILYGCGSALAKWDVPVIYVEVPKNEIQFRSRSKTICNLGATSPIPSQEQYKRFFFIDWQVLNRHKKALLPKIDVLVDEQRMFDITWMTGNDFRKSLKEMGRNTFRVRPWFSPGVWGGDWMMNRIQGLNQDEVNYAWSFEMIVPENGIVLESSQYLLEFSFDFLMFASNEAILGSAAGKFGDEFPIRFDFLDTFNGGNLSIQCHPTNTYIKKHFGENFTQDETYYILDADKDAIVYLGFQEDIDKDKFKAVLEESFRTNKVVEVEKFVQTFPAKKHDLFLIPNGTVHCSGINNLVLEISATPYIYTFKMYDWLRLDLNNKPRPLNIERAFENLNFDRKGEKVKQELISEQVEISRGEDWKLIALSTHQEHFYAVHRYEFSSSVNVQTENQCHILSLVEGTSILVTCGNRKQVVRYAETFAIPAAAGNYTLENMGEEPVKVLKVFVKEDLYV
ncbi:class I mannose-6-phosphate isomerase [Litoribacter alkaliphilus]|uniref:Class I mannose-6-phosphate isomerase n=1 Tax=Litoribacter ruber TaxID=702568 RepID=A0AAP2G625_9BACT|nr:class I mannose-6-phosphate isomerase [Litoribacter alkaliphilus]MBS9525636.1 class I mannose-6-phosphate isomerase [Litoribacter alkaliphilus]